MTNIMHGSKASYNVFEYDGKYYLSLKVTRELFMEDAKHCDKLSDSPAMPHCDLLPESCENISDALREAEVLINKNEQDIFTSLEADSCLKMTDITNQIFLSFESENKSKVEALLHVVKVKK